MSKRALNRRVARNRKQNKMPELKQVANTRKIVEHRRNVAQIIGAAATVVICGFSIWGFIALVEQRKIENRLIYLEKALPVLEVIGPSELEFEDGWIVLSSRYRNHSFSEVHFAPYGFTLYDCDGSEISPFLYDTNSGERIPGEVEVVAEDEDAQKTAIDIANGPRIWSKAEDTITTKYRAANGYLFDQLKNTENSAKYIMEYGYIAFRQDVENYGVLLKEDLSFAGSSLSEKFLSQFEYLPSAYKSLVHRVTFLMGEGRIEQIPSDECFSGQSEIRERS